MMMLAYFLVGCALAQCYGTPLRQRYPKVLAAAMLATIVAPLFVDHSARGIIRASTLLFALLIEALFRHSRYAFASNDNLRNAASTSFKGSIAVFVKVYVISAIATLPAPSWGLTAHGAPLWLQAAIALLAIDFYAYAYHYGQHRFGFWWDFHKVHHAVEEMTVLAAGRTHVIDFTVKMAGTVLLTYVLGLSPEAYLLGFVIPGLTIDALQHADVDFPGRKWRWLAYVFVTPNGHAVHHTPTSDRVNYGLVLSVWDVMFGTFELPGERPTAFGLVDHSWAREGLWWQHLEPVRGVLARLQRRQRVRVSP